MMITERIQQLAGVKIEESDDKKLLKVLKSKLAKWNRSSEIYRKDHVEIRLAGEGKDFDVKWIIKQSNDGHIMSVFVELWNDEESLYSSGTALDTFTKEFKFSPKDSYKVINKTINDWEKSQ